MRVLCGTVLSLAGLAVLHAGGLDAQAGERGNFFERIATFPVYKTLDAGVDPKTETVAEIVSASHDGRTLIFTDSPADALVFVDATLPADIAPLARVGLGGEPTSVAVAGGFAYAGVNTSESYTQPSGHLAVLDVDSKSIVAQCDVKGQPDAVATSPDGSFVAVAIENERDEDLNDGQIPQLPAGHLAVFSIGSNGVPTNCNSATIVDLTGLADVAPSDPEPEFVAINDKNHAVVTLQENNHIAIVDLASATVAAHFSAGTASVSAIPTKKARMSDASGDITDVPREPDAVAWIDDERFVTADEGDYNGGSRGFTIFDATGKVLFESGAQMEHLGMSHGHYPAKRAHSKGTEPEGVAVGKFGGETMIFVNSERANFVAVYRDTGAAPEFVQFLPAHVRPEGLLTIPNRDLLVVANEEDSFDDGVRATLSIYKFGAKEPFYPTLVSNTDPKTGAPIGWGAMSGMVADPNRANIVYAVSDSFYDVARIFTIDVGKMPAEIVSYVDVTGPTEKYDLEGIAIREGGGFWLSSEGHPGRELRHLVLQVAADGTVEKEITMPDAVLAQAKRFSFEGVAEFTHEGTQKVIVAVQREWGDDPKGHAKLGIYNPEDGSWGFVHYPLDAVRSKAGGWVGLSEITHVEGNTFVVMERDNRGGPDAAIKQLTMISLDGVTPAAAGDTLPVLDKQLVVDMLPAMASNNGWTPDKVEGLAITADGRILAVTDNDGVDDATGETQLLDLGPSNRLF